MTLGPLQVLSECPSSLYSWDWGLVRSCYQVDAHLFQIYCTQVAFVTCTWLVVTKGKQESKRKRKIKKNRNKSFVRDMVESSAVRDVGWEENEARKRAEDLVTS